MVALQGDYCARVEAGLPLPWGGWPMALGKKVMCRWKRERSTGCSRPGGWRWLSQGGVDARVSGSLAEDMLRAVVDMGDGARGEGKKVELYRGIRFR